MCIQAQGEPEILACGLSAIAAFAFSVGVRYVVRVRGLGLGKEQLQRCASIPWKPGRWSFACRPRKARRAGFRNVILAAVDGGSVFFRPGRCRHLSRSMPGRWLAKFIHTSMAILLNTLSAAFTAGSGDGGSVRGLRPDTLALIRDMRPPVIRYPGGNFASGYHWEDGIGPREQRPPRFDQAWNAWESNQVGTDEFLDFCAQVGAAPNLVVNDGSGTPVEAARWVAYCNEPADGEQGRRRTANGHAAPYDVRLWGVGNEVVGAVADWAHRGAGICRAVGAVRRCHAPGRSAHPHRGGRRSYLE